MAAGGAGGTPGMTPFSICVAGAESTGKSWLAGRIAAHFGVAAIPEYARGYCAEHGNALSLDQLIHIAEVQDRTIRSSVRDAIAHGAPAIIVADTDAVVTAAWVREIHGGRHPWFARELFAFDLTLVTDNDLPWVDDGVRIQRDNTQRDAFRATLITELEQRGRRWVSVGGIGDARLAHALAAIALHTR